MGIGAKFWDALKPYAKHEGFDFLRNKKVAVDLSLWIVQHNTALNSSNVRNPHIRLTFFRTINLFSKVNFFNSANFCLNFGDFVHGIGIELLNCHYKCRLMWLLIFCYV